MPTINFVTSGFSVEFPDGDDVNLLRIAIRNGCGVPYRCASGNCGTDRVLVTEGAENLSPPQIRERDRLGVLLEQGWRLACQTYVSGNISITWDPDQKALNAVTTDREIPIKALERMKNRWLSDKDTD